MRNFGILVKNNFNCLMGTLLGKKSRSDKKRTAIILTASALAFFAVFALICVQAYSMYKYMPGEMSKLALFSAVVNTLLIVLLLSVLKISGFSYSSSNDSELLLSLPVSKVAIVSSKTIAKYLFDLLFIFPLFFPYILFYLIQVQFSAAVLLCGLAVTLLLPLLSVGLGYILDFAVSRLFNKMRMAPLLKTFIILLFLIGFVVLSILSSNIYHGFDPLKAKSFVVKPFFIGWVVQFILTTNLLGLLKFLVIILPLFTVGVLLYAVNFGKNFFGYKVKDTSLNFNGGQKTVLGSLVVKEVKRYFNSPIWVINTILGPFLMVALSIFVCITGKNGLIKLLQMPGIVSNLTGFLTIIFCALAALCAISCSTISIEGKNFWVLKSLPVTEKQIFLSKALCNIVLVSPVSLLCTLVLSLVLKLSLAGALVFILSPILINIALSFGGLLVNLLLPKMNWNNEMFVVKNSASALLTQFLGLGISAVAYLFLFIILPKTSLWLASGLLIGVYAALAVGLFILLFTFGKKLYKKL